MHASLLGRAYTVQFSFNFEPNSNSCNSFLSQRLNFSFVVCVLMCSVWQSDGRMNFWQILIAPREGIQTDCHKFCVFFPQCTCMKTETETKPWRHIVWFGSKRWRLHRSGFGGSKCLFCTFSVSSQDAARQLDHIV